jgi:hypothetical protein
MARKSKAPTLTEHSSVPCVYVTGSLVHVGPGIVRVGHWSALPSPTGDTDELRIQVRYAMLPETARQFYGDLGRGLEAIRQFKNE